MTNTEQPNPDHDRGLEFDLKTLLTRRRAVGVGLVGMASAALAACAPSQSASQPSTSASSSTAAASSSSSSSASTGASASSSSSAAGTTRAIAECGVEIPDETEGPYPADGSNGPNVLEESGIVREDIRGSFGGGDAGVQEGIPLTLTLTILDNANGCVPYEGAAVYAWHCNKDGKYSMYDTGFEDDNFLRGVQEADENGQVTFTTIFPGAYMGRWPHIHFEVFDSLNNVGSTGQILKVSQVAMTDASCRAVYETEGYESSAQNFPKTTLTSDNVFGDDGGVYQLASTSGNVTSGYQASLNVTL
ncbi:3,4-dioxygenase subunit beta [Neomicrococcus aestuarii]|uniref:3,4-dioxygenase subunit beta n=1 Tax=Neomicrococcus aestuarii TaxID=556325 RepID=A0A1L2ZQY4_9MICC|nr:3,4-dioxygenase subunit beta [Neomicrococcus aestuarii]APF41422.1 3,4-dioxygenase subunit beta [Neomicrococcus aestuarii]